MIQRVKSQIGVEAQEEFRALLVKYRDVFAIKEVPLVWMGLVTHHIETGQAKASTTTFPTPYGFYEWNIMLFGLCNTSCHLPMP